MALFLFSLSSGGLAALTTLPWDGIPFAHGAVLFCFMPLWSYWLREPGRGRVFWSGWITQLVLALVAFHWIAHTVREFGHLSYPVSLLVLFLFAALANLHIPLTGVCWSYLFPEGRHSLGARVMGLALLAALLERVFPMIFEWHFGYAWLYQRWPAFQAAEWIGFRGLSSVSLLVNGLLLWAWRARSWRPAISAAAALLLLNGAGHWLERRLPDPDGHARIKVVQANIGNKLKHQAEHGAGFRGAILEKYLSLSSKGEGAVDFVLWPENAFPDYLMDGWKTPEAERLRSFLREKGLALATGGFGADEQGRLMNSIFFLSPEGRSESGPYAKNLLLAFGEYIPGAGRFPALKKWLPYVRDYGRGASPGVYSFRGLKLGPQICYEGLFDSFSRAISLAGAEILVNVTNDSWYGGWPQSSQHLYMTLARAVEFRLPLVRATNTGISALVSAKGEVLALSPEGEEWVGVWEVPYRKGAPPTFFAAYGYFLVPAALAMALAWLWIFSGEGFSSRWRRAARYR